MALTVLELLLTGPLRSRTHNQSIYLQKQAASETTVHRAGRPTDTHRTKTVSPPFTVHLADNKHTIKD